MQSMTIMRQHEATAATTIPRTLHMYPISIFQNQKLNSKMNAMRA